MINDLRTMKKTYIYPATEVVPVKMTQMLCTSYKTNTRLRYKEEADEDFDEEDIR